MYACAKDETSNRGWYIPVEPQYVVVKGADRQVGQDGNTLSFTETMMCDLRIAPHTSKHHWRRRDDAQTLLDCCTARSTTSQLLPQTSITDERHYTRQGGRNCPGPG